MTTVNVGLDSTCSGELPVMKAYDKASTTAIAADWSCYDGDQARGAPGNALFRLNYAPGGTMAAPGVPVDFYYGGSTLGAPDFSGVTDPNMGSVMLTLPSGVTRISVAQHARKDPTGIGLDTYEAREYDMPVVSGTSYIQAGVKILPANVVAPDTQLDASKASLVALIKDCSGRSVAGAQFELLDGQTGQPLGDSQSHTAGVPHPVYSQFALPAVNCTYTSLQDGGWGMVYAPTNISNGMRTQSYRLRVTGRKQASDAQPVTLIEREVELFAETLTLVHAYKLTPHP